MLYVSKYLARPGLLHDPSESRAGRWRTNAIPKKYTRSKKARKTNSTDGGIGVCSKTDTCDTRGTCANLSLQKYNPSQQRTTLVNGDLSNIHTAIAGPLLRDRECATSRHHSREPVPAPVVVNAIRIFNGADDRAIDRHGRRTSGSRVHTREHDYCHVHRGRRGVLERALAAADALEGGVVFLAVAVERCSETRGVRQERPVFERRAVGPVGDGARGGRTHIVRVGAEGERRL